MEIRRVDKELIQPAAASEAGSKVEVDRRPHDKNKQSQEKRKENENNEELTSEELAKFTTYNTEGHVEKQDLPSVKHINFKA